VKVLFDHNLPRRLRDFFPGHDVQTTREMHWEEYQNGALLNAAGNAGFEAIISVDKNIEHEQNLRALPVAIVVVNAPSNALPALIPFVPFILELLKSPIERMLYVIQADGTILRLLVPRH
jgi:predicted nuclease of predicted toxin-antitoxin system